MKWIWTAAAVAGLWLGGTQASSAQVEGPWCLHMTLGRGYVSSKCDMPSYEACRAGMRGLGGTYCTQNPYFWWGRAVEPQPRKAKRRTKAR